jgi:hypothetical protein
LSPFHDSSREIIVTITGIGRLIYQLVNDMSIIRMITSLPLFLVLQRSSFLLS